MLRRNFLSMCALAAASVAANDASAKGGNRRYWRSKKKNERKADLPKFCSERRAKAFKKCGDTGKKKEACQENVATTYDNCLKTGNWRRH